MTMRLADIAPSPTENTLVHYVTAWSGEHRALLAGPFPALSEAEAHVEPARQWLSAQSFKDTLSAFVEVGTLSARPRGGRAPLGRFNAQIAPSLGPAR